MHRILKRFLCKFVFLFILHFITFLCSWVRFINRMIHVWIVVIRRWCIFEVMVLQFLVRISHFVIIDILRFVSFVFSIFKMTMLVLRRHHVRWNWMRRVMVIIVTSEIVFLSLFVLFKTSFRIFLLLSILNFIFFVFLLIFLKGKVTLFFL